MPATEAANIDKGTHRSRRFGSQRNANQLQKTPSAIGSAKAPNADSSPLRAIRPSAKSLAIATSDVQRELGPRDGNSARSKVIRFDHPSVERSPSSPRWVMHINHDPNAHDRLPADASKWSNVSSAAAAGRIRI